MEIAMNWSEVEGNWKEVKGKSKQAWGHLTDDDLDKIAGKRDELEGIQKHYGLSKDVAKRNVDEWMQKIRSNEPEPKVQHVGGTNTGMIVLGGIFALVVVTTCASFPALPSASARSIAAAIAVTRSV